MISTVNLHGVHHLAIIRSDGEPATQFFVTRYELAPTFEIAAAP